MTELSEKQKKIIGKIKGLLAIADDANDEEGQSAFVLAQRLMIQNQITEYELGFDEEVDLSIDSMAVTIYKRLTWWEKSLAGVISRNFKVKYYTNTRRGYKNNNGTSIVFFGLERDLGLAKEMYFLAYELILIYSKRYYNDHYEKNPDFDRTKGHTELLKKSYIYGFIIGLDQKFKEQIHDLRQVYEMLVLTPPEVEDAFNEFMKDAGKMSIRDIGGESLNPEAFMQGKDEGNSIDFTKRTLDTDED